MVKSVRANFPLPALRDTLAAWESWNAERRRLRLREWLGELGAADDPAEVELIEVDGSERGQEWDDFWISCLGVRIKGQSKANDTGTVTIDGATIKVWSIRINRYDTEPYLEVRNPPFGHGRPDLRNLDPFRPADHQRVLKGLRLIGYTRRRGRKSLDELWDADGFHTAYQAPESIVRTRRLGRRASQLEVAAEIGLSERQLRRLISLFGKPPENPS
jgi:hypothetical protein